ncbi:MAG: hypothetical protein PHU25_04830 [Deltaproteobacteria bacterium]|nr:hypothetical protein [Deltaproteobacteria bacterium]
MKRTHLGDSIDIWKRGLIGYLRDAGAIGRVEVVPMMTDPRPWTQDELITGCEHALRNARNPP